MRVYCGMEFVTDSKTLEKPGDKDTIISLHEYWHRTMRPRVSGYISGELLRKAEDLREFIAIMRFESQESARALTNDPEHDAWYRRVVSLAENVPMLIEYTSEWP